MRLMLVLMMVFVQEDLSRQLLGIKRVFVDKMTGGETAALLLEPGAQPSEDRHGTFLPHRQAQLGRLPADLGFDLVELTDPA